jgi:spermidine synthase
MRQAWVSLDTCLVGSSGGVVDTGVGREARTIENGSGRLVLRERRGVVELVSGNVVLLSSAALDTERAFGRLAVGLPAAVPMRPRSILVGGLGFGMTARGVLDAVGPDARILVVEKVGAVERLVRSELAHIAGRPLDDERVTVHVGDVGDVLLTRAPGDLDAILLDVDNGPHWASFRSNGRLYTPSGLAAAARALSPAGILAVWSGYPADGFLASLRKAGLSPSVVPLLEGGRIRARAYVGVKR